MYVRACVDRCQHLLARLLGLWMLMRASGLRQGDSRYPRNVTAAILLTLCVSINQLTCGPCMYASAQAASTAALVVASPEEGAASGEHSIAGSPAIDAG